MRYFDAMKNQDPPENPHVEGDDYAENGDYGEDDYAYFDDGSFPFTNEVWPIFGNKIHSLLVDDQSLRFTSKKIKYPEDFEEAWAKKWTTATKLEIKHSSIRSISKEDDTLEIRIVYRTRIGIPGGCVFSFFDAGIAKAFLDYMEKEHYFTYTNERMVPFKAVSGYILGLASTIATTGVCCWIITGKNGGADDASDVKARLFVYLLNLLGRKGILAIGIGISGYLLFTIWKRATNPPRQTRLVRS